MALDIKGKTALVTGGGSGICLELTKKLLAGGCNVVIVDRQLLPEAEALVSASKSDAKAVYHQADVTNWEQLEAGFKKAIDEFGALHLVVPGAGVFEPPYSTFWEFKNDTAKDMTGSYKIFDINISHPIRATQLAIDSFMRQKLEKGVICGIASIAAQLTLLPVPLYCASKHAIAAFVRSLAPLEPAKGIRVNAVAPGIVKTPLWNPAPERLDWVDEDKDQWITTGQVADAMMELITKDEYVGGTILEVLAEKTRVVNLLNDPGPQGPGSTLEKIANGFNDVFPVIEKNFGK